MHYFGRWKPLMPTKELNKTGRVTHNSVKKTTEKRQAIVLTPSEFIKYKELSAKAERKKEKENKRKPPKNTHEQEKTVSNPGVNSHSCAECWENCYTTGRKDGCIGVWSVEDGDVKTVQFMQTNPLTAEGKL
jgi:hypothetical protein